jgi:hypothetical protein
VLAAAVLSPVLPVLRAQQVLPVPEQVPGKVLWQVLAV